jgi:hypothetical protein
MMWLLLPKFSPRSSTDYGSRRKATGLRFPPLVPMMRVRNCYEPSMNPFKFKACKECESHQVESSLRERK